MNYNERCDDCDDIVGIERKILANLPGGPDLVTLKLASLVIALDRLAELEQFQRLVAGRELKMIELKKEIECLRKFAPADEAEPGDPR